MMVSMVALRCCYDPRNLCREKKEENTATAGVMGKRYGKRDDRDQLLVQRRDWSHYWIAAAATTCFQWLKGCVSTKGKTRNFSYLRLQSKYT
ncbi:hypothetical protein NC652_016726 [Populus alba x Populus x berolinensis]|nr:hypothetical protein NC652_016726 [Populus alba x Populus x berolinensis]